MQVESSEFYPNFLGVIQIRTDNYHYLQGGCTLVLLSYFESEEVAMNPSLTSKYNVAGPRYTSYPTVPYWDNDSFSLKAWKSSLLGSYLESKEAGISLYIHLPFCESLCTFCGCTKRITRNHEVEIPYIRSLIRELQLYVELLGEKPKLAELHIGGGTPTFFSASNLQLLMEGIFRRTRRHEDAVMSFEGHPNNTTREHLKILADLGFTRVSYGVQDYNEKVQRAINRLQPFENVQHVTDAARQLGYTSVGHDIVFGLPFQTKEDIVSTIAQTIELRPDRIAFYSYAHVPWIKGNGQRGFMDKDLPSAAEKREQYEAGKQLLLDAGYISIGMDHFALPEEALAIAMKADRMHRNFMGYTESRTQVMIGLGISAIGDSWYSFAQNVKGLAEYQSLLSNNILPVYRGHILNDQDLVIRKHILDLMCHFKTSWEAPEMKFPELADVIIRLKELELDGLIEIGDRSMLVTDKGKPFVRNICMAFDLRLRRKKPDTQLFSMTV